MVHRQASTAETLDVDQHEVIMVYSTRSHGPFLQGHDGWPFVLEDVLIRMNTNQEFFAQPSSLKHGSSMTYLCQPILRVRLPVAECSPWWLKSKQPSIHMRSLLIG